ncbi:PucR family transcriptional regulator [Nocardiopsis ansamitocini]|uniref:PucR family transcriptional regulator n=1 Tax=Nocardiopsis ansamitocini TaxID=1670832 RepID=UPI002554F632|nr:PucR family transcriptional regulator [Nocardiopsis ansamitocini]
MPPTLGAILRTPRLRLRLLSGDGHLDNTVRWVAVSELTDPTPYLEGGELVLTTGVRWPQEDDTAHDYVRRLLDRGVAGLGFGCGVAHEEVPEALVDAAARLGLPLIAVPRETPFIAVGKEVSRLLAKDEYEGLSRAFDAQRQLTQAALRGAEAVVDRLGAELDGWVLLLAPDGAPRHARPPDAVSRWAGLTAEVRRLGAARQPASASLSQDGQTVSIQPLGVAGRIHGFIAVGGPRALGAEERMLVNGAISLLSLELERSLPGALEMHQGVLEALLNGAVAINDPGTAGLRSALPREPVTVALTDRSAAPLSGDPRFHDCLTGVVDECFVVVGGAGADPAGVLAELTGGPVGAGEPAGLDELPAARAQAARAFDLARSEERALVRHGDLPGGFLGLLDTPSGSRLAHGLLRPLLVHRSAIDLLASLRAYLAASGRWDAAAEALGVHRHTLRYRLTRIRELLPGDLNDPDYRAELWLALRMLEREIPLALKKPPGATALSKKSGLDNE